MCCDSAFYDLFSIFTSFFRAGFHLSFFIFRSRRFRFLPFAFGYLSFIRRGISFSVGPHSVFLLCSCGFFFAFHPSLFLSASGYLSFIRRGISFSVGPHNVFPPLLFVNGVFLTRSAYLYEGKGRRYTNFFARAKISFV